MSQQNNLKARIEEFKNTNPGPGEAMIIIFYVWLIYACPHPSEITDKFIDTPPLHAPGGNYALEVGL